MGEFSRVGVGIWHWLPFTELGCRERNLWMALYTSGPAKRICTGLWQGEITSMAGAASMRVDDTMNALDTLMVRNLVEFDRRLSVLRLTKLPDAGERPGSWKALKGMWNGFVTVPRCAVRDRHVSLMRWLVDQGNVSADMESMWRQTFGTIPVPSEASSSQLLADSDTSTSLQPGLFSKRTILPTSTMTFDSVSIDQGSGQGSGRERDQDQDPDPEGPRGERRLQLVRDPSPTEIAKSERSAYADEMRDAIRSAGGDRLIEP